MTNRIQIVRHRYGSIRAIDSHGTFHHFLLNDAMQRYRAIVGAERLGRVLGICCKPWEIEILAQMPFDDIVLTGITDYEQSMRRLCEMDSRISFHKQNAECLDFATQSFDLVYCKEGLHHLARPILGFYEMLRVCRRGAIFIEPNHTWVNRLLQSAGFSSSYEHHQVNMGRRDNFVFRFSPDMLVKLLNSYYLDSGYRLELRMGWLSSRYLCDTSNFMRRLWSLAGWTAGCLPGSRGNFMTAIVIPGKSLPADPLSYASLVRSAETSEYHG
ncbi:class I SAM-dependent methyltransferase [bacterium]|nr:class I SAM-dependent methyltransferase [bacterium]